jgi:predicted RNA-binding Zn ribbon-like protein
VHTGGEDERAVFEAWHAPGDLAAWLAESPLRLREVAIAAADLRVARALREAIWHSAIACLNGREPLAQWVQIINGIARQPDLVPQLDAWEQPSVWHPPHTASAALSTIARDAIALFAGAEARLIRQCANPECLLLFVDASRPGKRRWCSMERCGNRAKVAHYRRQRSVGMTGGRKFE